MPAMEKAEFLLTGRRRFVKMVMSSSIEYTAKAVRFQFLAVGVMIHGIFAV